jgi:cytochrome c oxidase subunit II
LQPFSIVDTRHIYDSLAKTYVLIAIGVFAAFTVVIIGTVIWFRIHPPAIPARWHEANGIEITYAVVLTCIAVFLLCITFSAEHQVDTASALERPALTVDVTGARWEWVFRYPGHGITRESGAVGDDPVVVPSDEPVRFSLRSADVIHSFWIPQLRFKRDLFPGTTESVTLDFDRNGFYGGECAEFCGLLHDEMVFTVDAVKPSVFRAWERGGGKASV